MQINLNEVRNQFKNLSDANTRYYDVKVSYDEQITQMGVIWNTGVSQSYYNTYMNQRAKHEQLVHDGDELTALLGFINQEYSQLGTQIYFNEYNVTRLNQVLNTYISKIESIVSTYSSVDTSEMTGDDINVLNRQANHYRSELSTLKSIKTAVSNAIQFINNTEDAVRRKTNGIVITRVTPMDVHVENVGGSANYDLGYMRLYNDNMRFIAKNETQCIQDVNNVRYYLVDGYSTKNTSLIQDKMRQMVDGMRQEVWNHENDTQFVSNEIDKIVAVENVNAASFSTMDVNEKVKTV